LPSMSGFKMVRRPTFAAFVLLLALCGLNLFMRETPSYLSNYIRRMKSIQSDPFITFIVPSLLRDSLPDTIKSITTQSDPNWEALVGVDLDILSKVWSDSETFKNTYRTDTSLAKGSTFFPPIEDGRVRLSLIREAEHVTQNSAGEVRNRLMESAKGEWLAFVDDDDTVNPCFTEWLKRGIEKATQDSEEGNGPDLVLFRMQRDGKLIPSLDSNLIVRGLAGISFAMRRELFTEKGIRFDPSMDEDYRLMYQVYSEGNKVSVANCVGYFVHGDGWDPRHRLCNVDGESTCQFVTSEVKQFYPDPE